MKAIRRWPWASRCDDRALGALAILAEHAVGVDRQRRAVDEDEPDAGRDVTQQVAVVVAGRDDDQPVHAAVEHGLDQLALTLDVLVRAAREGDDAAVARDLLDAAVDRGEERVRDVLEDQAERGREAVGPAQRARRVVVPVAEHLDRALDLDRQLGRDRVAVDDARDGAEADARDRRDVLHRGPTTAAGRWSVGGGGAHERDRSGRARRVPSTIGWGDLAGSSRDQLRRDDDLARLGALVEEQLARAPAERVRVLGDHA